MKFKFNVFVCMMYMIFLGNFSSVGYSIITLSIIIFLYYIIGIFETNFDKKEKEVKIR